ncbi:MAG: type II toxin-antitoxin system VapC family toxin [Janthinobacterium lividum]
MKLLLDTHTLLWWLDDNPTLSSKAKKAISNEKNTVYVSAVNAWEIVIKKSLGKLEAPDNLQEVCVASNFIELPISIKHTSIISQLPKYHDDPFDRLLIAQAMSEGLTLVTRDARIVEYDVTIIES